MKQRLLRLLCCGLVAGTVSPLQAITIIPSFDASITTNANQGAIMAAVTNAIQAVQTNLTDNLTVKIKFVADEQVGLGQSSTWGTTYSYTDFLTALRARAAGGADAVAMSRIPVSSTDPVVGSNVIYLSQPLARLMGLATGYGPDGYDSTVSCKMSVMNFTRPPADPNKYDLVATLEHEINEVLGFSSNLKSNPQGPITPIDLFRYTTNLARTYTTNGDDAYFSIDGTNLLARFNQDLSGDSSDFWSANGTWSPPGTTPRPQVQDAFGGPGGFQDEGTNELTALDVIGYTLVSTPPPVLNITLTGGNQLTLSWTNSAAGFALQQRTNFVTGTWAAAATGTNNPAVLAPSGAQSIFRLIKNAPAGIPPRQATSLLAGAPLQLQVHSINPRGR